MESALTKRELDAVRQLIQLSTVTAAVSDLGGYARAFCAEQHEERSNSYDAEEVEDEEESVGDAFSATAIDQERRCEGEEETLARRKPRSESLLEIYRRTTPLIAEYTARYNTQPTCTGNMDHINLDLQENV